MNLQQYQAVFLDIDGTLYKEDVPLPGALELVSKLHRSGQPFACLSNSTLSPAQVQGRLARMGMDIPAEKIYTAAAAAADFVMGIAQQQPSTRVRVFNLATAGLHELLENRVLFVENQQDAADIVVVGTPTNPFADFDRQRIALVLLRRGARLLGMCADRIFPSPRGIEFGSGALTHMLAYAASVPPVFTGKPEPIFFEELAERMSVSLPRCVLIGDNLESDIAGGKRVGMQTVLTLTGISRLEDVQKLSESQQPELIIKSLADL